jgi:hypothetical protein
MTSTRIDNNSQATINYNGTPDHGFMRVHKAITSDNSHNHRKSLKLLDTVVYGINYYRKLISMACEVFVKGRGVGVAQHNTRAGVGQTI